MASAQASIQRVGNCPSCILHKLLGFSYIDESAGYDIRSGEQAVRSPFQSKHHDDNAVLRQMLSVAKHDVSNIAHAKTVHKDRACVYLVHDLRRLVIQLQHIARLDDKDILLRDTQRFRDLRVCLKVTVLAVHRNGIFRFHKRVDQFQLFLTGMS